MADTTELSEHLTTHFKDKNRFLSMLSLVDATGALAEEHFREDYFPQGTEDLDALCGIVGFGTEGVLGALVRPVAQTLEAYMSATGQVIPADDEEITQGKGEAFDHRNPVHTAQLYELLESVVVPAFEEEGREIPISEIDERSERLIKTPESGNSLDMSGLFALMNRSREVTEEQYITARDGMIRAGHTLSEEDMEAYRLATEVTSRSLPQQDSEPGELPAVAATEPAEIVELVNTASSELSETPASGLAAVPELDIAANEPPAERQELPHSALDTEGQPSAEDQTVARAEQLPEVPESDRLQLPERPEVVDERTVLEETQTTADATERRWFPRTRKAAGWVRDAIVGDDGILTNPYGAWKRQSASARVVETIVGAAGIGLLTYHVLQEREDIRSQLLEAKSGRTLSSLQIKNLQKELAARDEVLKEKGLRFTEGIVQVKKADARAREGFRWVDVGAAEDLKHALEGRGGRLGILARLSQVEGHAAVMSNSVTALNKEVITGSDLPGGSIPLSGLILTPKSLASSIARPTKGLLKI